MKILAGDIGGTKSRLAVFELESSGMRLSVQKTFPSAEYSCLEEIISDFLATTGVTCEVVCLGIPGPVTTEAVVRLTNLPWQVDYERIRRVSGAERVKLINDVEASAAGVDGLAADDLVCLRGGTPDPSGNRAVISVGTGLGVAGLTASGRAFATEAGHASFSPRCDFDCDLLRELSREYGHVSWERVAAGPAMPRIYSFLAPPGSETLPTSEIVARSVTDAACRRTVEIFSAYVGAAAGNIALTLMATGGVYFCGGVAPRVINTIGADSMLAAFLDKGRMTRVLERMPVYLVGDHNLALIGAAQVAQRGVD